MGDWELSKRNKRVHPYHEDDEGYPKDIGTASLLPILRPRWAR
jgi:hypothetical protein